MAKQMLRFAFTIADGPNAGQTSGGWRVWTLKEDTYIAPAGVGHMWKCSLHGDAAWRWAVTTEHIKSGEAPVWPDADRAPWKFEPPPFVDGRRLAFVICTFRHALLPRPVDPNSLHIRVADRWDEATLAYIWMTEPGVELERLRPIGDPMMLRSGRRVWVEAGVAPVPDGTDEPQAISSMLEPVVPGPDGPTAPGVFHKGVHVD